MRRSSSEGSLLDLDFLPWKQSHQSGTFTHEAGDARPSGGRPVIREPRPGPGGAGGTELTKEHSVSAETLSELGKQEQSLLSVGSMSEGCRAYSDSQLAPAPQGSTDRVEGCNLPPPSPSSPFKAHNKHHPKLVAAKLHLKNLFVQVGP